jgi:asparagine synthase (glutamine-hydrolysing)
MNVRADIAHRLWSVHRNGTVTLTFAGYLFNDSPDNLAARLAAQDAHNFEREVPGLDGHFALIVQAGSGRYAAVDRVRSIPLFWCEANGEVAISHHAPDLAGKHNLPLDEDQVAIFAMAGFTMTGKTLYRGLYELKPGEWIESVGGKIRRGRYYQYRPWRTRQASAMQWRKELADTTLAVFEKMVRGIVGRPILVPLSGGLDSRVVASALKHLNVRNVKCFAYGLPGNFEAMASKAIAEKLGFEWIFVPHSPGQQARTFAGDRDYREATDSLCAVPFHQDLHAMRTLLANGYAPRNAVVVNGQSGDFISGNHVPAALFSPGQGSEQDRWQRIFDALVAKHYSLWDCLKTPANLLRVERELAGDFAEDGVVLGTPERDYAIYEYSEYQNRQAKYVINGQRIYDFLGVDWRLPLWDRDFVDFWEGVPIEHKRRQALYRETLMAENWGGVWDRASWPRNISPHWMRPLRFALRAAHLPLGRERWHKFERRYLSYWMDIVANYAVVSYGRVARDRRGHRNAISWHVERYLAEKGVGFDGRPLPAAA